MPKRVTLKEPQHVWIGVEPPNPTPSPSRVSDSQVSVENIIYEAFVVMGLGNSCRKGNTKRKYTSRRDTSSKIAVTFEPILQSSYPLGIKMS